MDMSAGYAGAVNKYLPHAAIVFDRFHITKVLTQALDDVRKEELACNSILHENLYE